MAGCPQKVPGGPGHLKGPDMKKNTVSGINAYRTVFIAAAVLMAALAIRLLFTHTEPYTGIAGICVTVYFIILFGAFLNASLKNTKNAALIYMCLLIAGAFAVYCLLAVYIPYNDGPDEVMRYDVVRFVREHGYIPRGDEPSIVNEMWGISYAYYPCLPYIIAGFLCRGLEVFGLKGDGFLIVSRLAGVCYTMVTVILSYFIGKTRFEKSAKYALPMFIAFFPGLINVSYYVSCESFAVMSSALVILAWIRGKDGGWKTRDCILLAAGMALILLSYNNSYGFIFVSVPFFFITIAGKDADGKRIAKAAALVTALTFAFAGWWFIRNGILYGDVTARSAANAFQEIHMSDEVRGLLEKTPQKLGLTVSEMLYDTDWLRTTKRSFIGGFSQGRLEFTAKVYLAAKWFFRIAFAGAVISVICGIADAARKKTQYKKEWALTAAMFLAAVIPAVISVIYSYTSDYQPQGRYLIPGFIAISYFVIRGYDIFGKLAGKLFKKAGGFVRDLPGILVALYSAFMMITVVIQSIVPYYYMLEHGV